MQLTQVFVPSRDQGGYPSIVSVPIKCTQAQYENGDHYDAAIEAAQDIGYEVKDRVVCFDSCDVGEHIHLWDQIADEKLSKVDITANPVSTD